MLYEFHAAGQKIHCLLCDYKQDHIQELLFAKAHCHRLGVMFTTVELPPLGGLAEPDWIVPNRNMVMLSIAVNLAMQIKADTVTIGCNLEDKTAFPDCRQAFIEIFNVMLITAELGGIEVRAPYIALTKRDIATKARTLGVPLHEIWTCYKGGSEPCGKCPACRKLQEALA